ncbi:MAG: helicase-related protein [Pseudophaeobacter sp. bin_em_oilr2.035]|uniref:Helicase-related protein n=1 Tax=Phaeobacter gallaeciensis TaxID=60890 RepID=A0ABD4X9Y4_9RHOB|nr:helicase-related protein [Phaeobacter gallaeciensis]MDF1771677.1 helicase-related protein [Pseudophaeobacter sp. bin_em_oilr2.035]MDE4145255.1 helicase-related protein [Phaeobacter gallaeciensis]MDE4157926.1 helicase-related protein [Phaeobacter gallaeciensis]MDE4162105.1 helicase-related protein [Phaeobacter gallaeciensis]MDE4166331.1 helicase-related protein [Phaeobacter gallaeciensis]
MANASRVTAVLGPTNTGKTHYAIDRMLGYRTGIMGFPLRLLAREVYDKIVAARGPSVVALLTGEERIVPPRAQYWICTVEAMPEGMGCDFLAIDEIQLCADPERGHVFTDRLLRARGTHETLFLGADTMRGPIQALVPGVEFVRRERMSDLVYAGSKKISRMPPRTAIVGFSVDNVYAIAELIRRQKGGAAVVMGALSPRTRNAQVALYQNGEVDYLVATDAIGMGLNLDIDHVAFASTSKFDGRRMRPLAANELAQIAGRAGRGMSHGSFGVTGDARPLDEGTAQAIMEHRFTPLKKLNWRSSALQFGTVEALIRSLEAAPQDEFLMKAREADDLGALKALSQDPDILARTTNAPSVRLLWDVCRIPDFRGISHAEHASLLRGIFNHLHGGGVVPDDWLARQIKRIDRTDGNIDALSKRLAFIRTWTYVAQRKGWLRDEIHWRNETRAVEDRLSDALHERLTEKFVDRRTSVLLRRLKQKEALLAEVNDKGEVTVEGEFVGRLEGFRFSPDKGAEGAEAKALKSASLQALAPHFHLRADRFYNAPDTEIDFTEQGGLMWGDSAIGKLVAGADPLTPGVQVFVDDAAGTEVAQKVERRLQHFISRKVQSLFEPLLNLQKDEELNGLARGFAFRMVEALGLLPRHTVAQEVKDLDQDARGALRKHGVRFGQFTIFMPLLLKPAPTRLRLVLWSLANGLQDFPEAPPPGLVTVPALKDAPQGYDTMSGYREAGERMIRIDMLERLADMLRAEDSRGGFEAKPDMLSITGMTLEQFADLMQGLGYRAEKGEREKVKPADAVVAETGTPAAGQPVMDAAADAENTPAAAPAGEGAAPAADVVPEAAAIADEGVAPIAETGSDAAAEEPVPEVAENETPVGEAADTSVEAPEVEVFYTFTWGGRARQGGNRGQRRGQQGQDTRGNAGGGKGKPRGAKGGAGGGKPGGKKGGRPQQQGGKTYSARPPKKEKKIDPDNPFAAALMGLKQGD